MKKYSPYKIASCWIVFFFCIATPMFLFRDIIKQNEILTFLFVGTAFCMIFISPLIGLWFLNATKHVKIDKAKE